MIRVVIVDDHSCIRQGLRMRLSLEPDIAVVGEAACGEDALALVCAVQPDIVLMDIEMPGVDGITVAAALRRSAPGCSVILLSLYDDRAMLRQAEQAEAAGFVTKQDADGLLPAIRSVAGGSHRGPAGEQGPQP